MSERPANTAAHKTAVLLAAAAVVLGPILPAAGQVRELPPATSPSTSPANAFPSADSLLPVEPTAEPAPEPVYPAAPANRAASVTADDVRYSGPLGTVEIHVNDADVVEVLRMLSMQSQTNIIASRQVHGKVTASLYDVTVREALDAILASNGYAYREKGNFTYVYTAAELAQIQAAERKPETRVFRLFYTNAVNATNMIKPVLSPAGQVAVSEPAVGGLPTGAADTGGNSSTDQDMIVVTDYAENLDKIAAVLKEIDRRPQQILVEATILRASISDDNALGIDFNLVGGVDFTNIKAAGGQITGTGDGTVVAGDTPRSIGTGNSFSSSVPGGLKAGIIGGDASVFVSALEGVTDTVILANPKVLALNKQRGEVFVGRDDGYKTTTVSETTSVQSVEFLKTGTRLLFRPFIADDGYIRMEVHPEDSDGGITAAELPFKVTTEVTSNIMVKDGHTIVIGGLFRDVSSTTKSQVPFFGNIPLAGALFRNQRDRTQREEVIILLTPHIVKDEIAYSDLSAEQLKAAEELRVGVRKGMMPWGRDRLAEGAYERAMTELAKPTPDRGRALFYLDAATNLNPKFLEAIQLKQDLTGRVVTSADNSSIRTFVSKSILAGDAAPPQSPRREVRIGSADSMPPITPTAPTLPTPDNPPAPAAPVPQSPQPSAAPARPESAGPSLSIGEVTTSH